MALPVLAVCLWQIGSSQGWWSVSVLPSPTTVAHTFGTYIDNGQLPRNLLVSLRRVAIGASIGIGCGLALGVTAGLWKLGEEMLDTALQMMRTLPVLVLLPLFVIWFGIDETPKIVIIAFGTTFPVYLNTYNGIRGVDPRQVEMARTFGLRRWSLISRVVVPGALPSVLAGVRYAMGGAWLILVVAEQINARSGIGLLINDAQSLFEANVMLMCVVTYALLGLISDLIVRLLERRLLRWRPTLVTSRPR